MDNEVLFETIFRRKSTRKYDMTPLPQQTLEMVKEFVGGVKALDETIKYECIYLGAGDVKNMLPIKAPHYICLYSEKKSGYLMNTGFILQQADLFLSANGIASCWLGLAKPAREVEEPKDGLEYIIMLAFGNTGELVQRTDPSVFIRKGIDEISTVEEGKELLEPVRLAPSASNSQPWFFSGSREEINVSREKPNFLKAPIYERMNQIDVGIALCHLWLSIEHQGKSAVISFPNETPPKGHEYMAKVTIRSRN